MEKVILNQQEIEALESALEINSGDKGSVVHWHANNLWDGKREVLNYQDLDLIIRALYVGYEVEAGPEEQVLNLYKFYSDNGFAKEIIEEVLGVFNFQIKGINC